MEVAINRGRENIKYSNTVTTVNTSPKLLNRYDKIRNVATLIGAV
jgi:hypothetical protein